MSVRWLAATITPAYSAVAGSFARSANSHRFTRTVLAIRMFRERFGSWPETLDQLSRVGLPRSVIQAYDGGTFAYEVGAGDLVTVYNQADPRTQYVALGTEAEAIEIRPSSSAG
jgi:hypothetical protein